MKQKQKRFIGILLTLSMVIGLMQGMGLTARATTATYTNLIPTGSESTEDLANKVVKFNNIDWYIIEDDSTAVNAGTVTLFAKDIIGASVFHDSTNIYSSSTVRSYLDRLLMSEGTNSFKDVAYAISPVTLTTYESKSTTAVFDTVENAKLWLLSAEEAYALPKNVRIGSSGDGGYWWGFWLRSPGNHDGYASYVFGNFGDVIENGKYVNGLFGVRPALKLDLSSVIFSSESKTFSLSDGGGGSHTPSTPSTPLGPIDSYANLIPTGSESSKDLADKVVYFNNIDWYIIKDESTASDAGTVTLLAKDPIGASKFRIF